MATYRLAGPDAAGVGWIPRYDSLRDLPHGHRYTKSLAMRLLFNSGNPAPLISFGNFGAFSSWLDDTREYRAALYLRDVSLEYSNGNPYPTIDYKAEALVGFTPPRIILAKMDFAPWPVRGKYLQGLGANELEPQSGILEGGEGVWIRHRVQFKLSFWVDLVGWAFTGYWAPSAWMEIFYRIFRDGSVQIDFSGSAIPSQAYYVDWGQLDRKNMVDNSATEIREFMETAKGCTKAPEGARFSYRV